MDKDAKSGVIVFIAFTMFMLAIFAAFTISHEITKNGDAKRCAEYNYECKGDSNGTTQD